MASHRVQQVNNEQNELHIVNHNTESRNTGGHAAVGDPGFLAMGDAFLAHRGPQACMVAGGLRLGVWGQLTGSQNFLKISM